MHKFLSFRHTQAALKILICSEKKGIAPPHNAHESFICTTAECTLYRLTVWPATNAGPEETETKRRTSKLPVKTINSLYSVCLFPVGSMSRPSSRHSSSLLFKFLSSTSFKQLHALKNCGTRLEWSKSQLVQAGNSSKALFSPLWGH